jgi:hypothetical protein
MRPLQGGRDGGVHVFHSDANTFDLAAKIGPA